MRHFIIVCINFYHSKRQCDCIVITQGPAGQKGDRGHTEFPLYDDKNGERVRDYSLWHSGKGVGLATERSRVQIPAAALSSATLDKLFTHIVQRLWCYDLMALYKSV